MMVTGEKVSVQSICLSTDPQVQPLLTVNDPDVVFTSGDHPGSVLSMQSDQEKVSDIHLTYTWFTYT